MPNQITDLSIGQLRRAIELKEQIARLQSELNALGGGRAPAPAAVAAPAARKTKRGKRGKRGQLSPEARARIAEAQRQRWAKYKSAKGNKAAAPKRKGLSPEARAKISEAARRRWARVRAGKGK